jgi:hypothetical protein
MGFSDHLCCYTRGLALLAVALAGASLCSAAAITYNVNQTVGVGGVTGFIKTDGTLGVLAQTDILGYDLLLNDGTDPPVDLNSLFLVNVFEAGSDLSASSTQLLFNFGGTDRGSLGFVDPSLDFGVCFTTTLGCFAISSPGPGEATKYSSLNSPLNNQFTSVSGTQVIGTSSSSTSSTPEPSTLALLGAGLVLFGFRKLGCKHSEVESRWFQFWGFVLSACNPF